MNLYSGTDAGPRDRRVLIFLSKAYPRAMGRFDTCYAPVRRSPATVASYCPAAPRLACVKPVASVHPEPGSNSSLYIIPDSRFPHNRNGPEGTRDIDV